MSVTTERGACFLSTVTGLIVEVTLTITTTVRFVDY